MSAVIFFSLPAVSTNSNGHSIRPPRFEQYMEVRGCRIPVTSSVLPSRSCEQAFANSVGTPVVLHAELKQIEIIIAKKVVLIWFLPDSIPPRPLSENFRLPLRVAPVQNVFDNERQGS